MNSSSRLDRRRRRRGSACDDDDDDDDFFYVKYLLGLPSNSLMNAKKDVIGILFYWKTSSQLLKKNERICHALCFPRHRGNIFY